MKLDIKGNFDADEKTRRYASKVIGSLESLLPREDRETARAIIILRRVNRAHGNKYEAEVKLRGIAVPTEAKDSTLNVLAALDIVRLKLAIELKKDAVRRLPKRQNRV